MTVIAGSGFFASDGSAADTRSITFPILGGGRYSNDFGAPRVGHTHEGNDIFAPKHQPLVSVVNGRIRRVAWPQPSYGYMVSITDDEGWQYWYLHINNDTPGTDDGKGGGRYAYYPGAEDGAQVVKGQIIGYLGDSGNAESTASHVHFEIHSPDGSVVNPFPSLNAAPRIGRSVPGPALDGEVLPFGEFKGGASITYGELTGNSAGEELVVGAGPGGGPLVRIFDEFNNPLGGFYAYDKNFPGGVDVTVGDVNGDGTNEIITAAGTGGGPHIRAFTLKGELLLEFYAYKETFLGGVHVSVDDLDGDGVAEIVTAPKANGTADVRIYRGTGEQLHQWLAYSGTFKKGIDIATVPASASELGKVITSPLRGGGPDVRVYDNTGVLSHGFFAYDAAFRGGVRVAAERMTDGSIEIITVPNSGASGHIKRFNQFGQAIDDTSEYEEWWSGGFDIAISPTQYAVSTAPGGRRASVRRTDIHVAPSETDEDDFDWWQGRFGD